MSAPARAGTLTKKSARKKGDAEPSPKEKDEERVNVVVRIRPPLSADEGGADNMSLQADLARDMVWALGADEGGDGTSFSKATAKAPKQFVFDRVIPPSGTQEAVYDAAAERIIKSVLEGFTGCVMCYGQTGAGKTHTLANEAPGTGSGVMIRAFDEIFAHIGADAEHEYSVEMAYLQVYLEALYDLLEPSAEVQIREDTKTGVFTTGLSWRPVHSPDDARAVLADGNRNRATASTQMNADSSRSHAVMMLQLTRRGGTRTLMGKLYLVDLAGSERIKKSGVEGQGLDEAISINKSLTTLGRCIEAMAKNSKSERPPFRESKLTRLLSNAIGGNAKTTLIVCVAPSKRDTFETHNSLEFGQQAMNVVVRARVNATLDYGGLSANLQAQLDGKQGALHALEAGVLAQLAPQHERVLALEAEARALTLAERRARADADGAKRAAAELRGAKPPEVAAAEARRDELAATRHRKGEELARVLAKLDDTPELHQLRAQQHADQRALADELARARAETEATEAAAAAARGGGAADGERELLVGVARNLGNLALHFVHNDARSDAEPLVISAQTIFEAVLGAEHDEIAIWKADMFRAISEQAAAAQAAKAGGAPPGGAAGHGQPPRVVLPNVHGGGGGAGLSPGGGGGAPDGRAPPSAAAASAAGGAKAEAATEAAATAAAAAAAGGAGASSGAAAQPVAPLARVARAPRGAAPSGTPRTAPKGGHTPGEAAGPKRALQVSAGKGGEMRDTAAEREAGDEALVAMQRLVEVSTPRGHVDPRHPASPSGRGRPGLRGSQASPGGDGLSPSPGGGGGGKFQLHLPSPVKGAPVPSAARNAQRRPSVVEAGGQ